jgi:hypothetical protein
MVIKQSIMCIVTSADENHRLEKKFLYLRPLVKPKLTIEHQTPVEKNGTYRIELFKGTTFCSSSSKIANRGCRG